MKFLSIANSSLVYVVPTTSSHAYVLFSSLTAQEQERYSPGIRQEYPARVYGALHKKSSSTGAFSYLHFDYPLSPCCVYHIFILLGVYIGREF